MASEAHVVEDEYDEPVAEELLLTERLEDDTSRTPLLLHVDTSDEREKPRYSDIVNGDDDDDDGSESPPQGCWDTAHSSSDAMLMEESAQLLLSSKVTLSPHNEPQRRRKMGVNTKDQQLVQSLTRKLSQYKKLNAELHHQLQAFYKNEAVAQLENKNKEKQIQIDQLLHENRMLSHQQRLLAKQIEELQDTKDNFPRKKYALQEELRICKERLRQFKETQKDADDKTSKMHQQAADLATKNKVLVERVKKLEAAVSVIALSPSALSAYLPVSPSSIGPGGNSSAVLDTESIIASQEDEITRLQQRVALMKKTHRADKVKQERQLKANHEEIEQTRTQLEVFYQQLFTKEKTIRSLFLQMKKLKRAVQDLSNAQQTNQHMQQMVFGREVRFPTHSPTHNHSHAQQYHRSASHHQLGHANHASLSSTQSLPFAESKKATTTDRIHDTLRQLGYIPSFATSGKHSKKREFGGESLMEIGGNGVIGEEEEDEEELPPNVVQGKLIPCPPPLSVSRSAVRNGTPMSRNQFYSPSSRESSRETLETALDIERDDGGALGQGDGGRDEAALDDFGTRGFEERDLEDDVDGEREEFPNEGRDFEIGPRQSRSEDEQEDPGVPSDAEDDDLD